MPVYEYTCENHECEMFSVLVERMVFRYEEKNFQECEYCGEPLYSRISAGSFTIRGDSTRNNWGLR